ncbi:MAG TPA: ABC transporter substrate-binding protein [Candidatus Sulfotelmatobacter sp.]|nr:ABC transporter substrate-binding protein [Candidatus Sulfotelmatobacter sp.]
MRASYSPTRIACLQPSATVMLDAIGELDRLVACTRYCLDVAPQLVHRSPMILADSWTAKANQILEAKPDLVIASVPYQQNAVGEILKAGVRFLGLAPRTLDDIYSDISTISGAVGAMQRGNDVVREMQRHIDAVQDRAKHHSRLRVFCEEWGKPIIASQSWVAELVEAAGGTFLSEPGRSLTSDEILQLDPDIIVVAWCGAGDRVPLKKLVRERGWRNTKAALNGRIYCVRDEFLNTPAPTLLRGLDALAWAIHPELFPRTEGIRQITVVPASATDID